MSRKQPGQLSEMLKMIVNEVSLVDKGANRMKILWKRAGDTKKYLPSGHVLEQRPEDAAALAATRKDGDPASDVLESMEALQKFDTVLQALVGLSDEVIIALASLLGWDADRLKQLIAERTTPESEDAALDVPDELVEVADVVTTAAASILENVGTDGELTADDVDNLAAMADVIEATADAIAMTEGGM